MAVAESSQTGPVADGALVILRAGDDAAPLICVRAAAGHLRPYESLARRLASGRPVWGLQAVVGDNDPHRPYPRIEALAEMYVHALRDARPRDPYLLLSECVGGVLAYEMAQQLRSASQDALLMLIDSWAPGWPRLKRGVPPRAYRAANTTRMLMHHVGTALRGPADARRRYVTERVTRVMPGLRRRSSSPNGGPTGEHLRTRAFYEAAAAYDPRPYDGRVVLFRASELPRGAAHAPDLGWSGLVKDLSVIEIPAYFGTTILTQRPAESLAAQLERTLAQTVPRVA